jgi:hypothetical protein
MKQASKPIVLVFAILLIFVITGLPVGAQTGINSPLFPGNSQQLEGNRTNEVVPGGPGFIMIHPSAFIPIYSGGEYKFGPGGVLQNPSDFDRYYIANVNLPHGATINKIVAYYYDNHVSDWVFYVALVRFGPADNSFEVMGNVVSYVSSPDYQVKEDLIIDSAVVDNQSYSYFLETYLEGGQESFIHLRSVRIDYSYPVNLPLINK